MKFLVTVLRSVDGTRFETHQVIDKITLTDFLLTEMLKPGTIHKIDMEAIEGKS